MMRSEDEIQARLRAEKQELSHLRDRKKLARLHPETVTWGRDEEFYRQCVGRQRSIIATLEWVLVAGRYKMMETKRRQKEQADAAHDAEP
jgi:hypothetical protein